MTYRIKSINSNNTPIHGFNNLLLDKAFLAFLCPTQPTRQRKQDQYTARLTRINATVRTTAGAQYVRESCVETSARLEE